MEIDNVFEMIEGINGIILLSDEKVFELIEQSGVDTSNKVIPFLKSLYELTIDTTNDRIIKMEAFCEKLLEYGWVIYDGLPYSVYEEEFKSKNEADEYIKKNCNNETIADIFDYLSNHSVSFEDIYNIKTSYYCCAYKACASLIISTIENYIVCKYRLTDNAILKLRAIEKIKKSKEVIALNSVVIFLYLKNYSIYLAVKEVFKNIDDLQMVDDSEFPIPSRHCLQHGYSKRKYTQDDCLFLILLLFGLVSQKEHEDVENGALKTLLDEMS